MAPEGVEHVAAEASIGTAPMAIKAVAPEGVEHIYPSAKGDYEAKGD